MDNKLLYIHLFSTFTGKLVPCCLHLIHLKIMYVQYWTQRLFLESTILIINIMKDKFNTAILNDTSAIEIYVLKYVLWVYFRWYIATALCGKMQLYDDALKGYYDHFLGDLGCITIYRKLVRVKYLQNIHSNL